MSTAHTLTLFEAVTEAGEHVFDVLDARATPGAAGVGQHVEATLGVGGTWDGAEVAVSLQVASGGPWFPLEGSPLTEDKALRIDAHGMGLRLAVANAGATTSLTAQVCGTGPAYLMARAV